MESSLQELSQDFEKKLEELKSQAEIPMAEDSEIKDWRQFHWQASIASKIKN